MVADMIDGIYVEFADEIDIETVTEVARERSGNWFHNQVPAGLGFRFIEDGQGGLVFSVIVTKGDVSQGFL